ncbi:MAG: cation-translocating P-type ATPase [Micrococcales bacterium]|nr:cation-translocating P-type ATPase [Micrococcales bacterium]
MHAYEVASEELLAELGTDPEVGLPSDAVAAKLRQHGRNEFDEQATEGILAKILHNLREVTTIILLVAAALSLVMAIYGSKDLIAFFVIFGIVVLNMTLGITQETSAEKSLAALRNLNSPTTLVLRQGLREEINSADLVPGDIILISSGNLISADARLLDATDLTVDESTLTGESEPSEKSAQAQLSGKVAVADQANMVFAGCLVTAGRATAVVTATGMDTQMGHIAGYLGDTQKLKTPLQVRIDKIGKVISLIALAAALTMLAVGFKRGEPLMEMALVAIAVGVAAVPEMLALIVTLTLAYGVTQMVKKNALIRKLPAVETLGSTSVICTDKTGTLTQNRMRIRRLWCQGGQVADVEADFSEAQTAFMNKFALVVNAVAETQADGEVKIIGTPTEAAVIHLLQQKSGSKATLEAEYPRVAEIAFSSERKMSTSIHQDPAGGYLVLTSGAFDRVPFAATTTDQLDRRQAVHDAFAKDAFRILSLGSKHIDQLPAPDQLGQVEKNLVFEGIVGIMDPPREEVAAAIAKARNAGIRTIMITGDHAATAEAIGRQIGLMGEGGQVITGLELEEMNDEDLIDSVASFSVHARVSPEDKIRIVEAWQEHDEVVAMTGDGVNDAPALKAADVGVAMGIAGTEVSKSAADMILTDDNYSTIVAAVEQGRAVFTNIRKTVYFLLTCNFAEIIIMLGAFLTGWGLPLTPIMLLLINVVGDGIPGLALAREKAESRIMRRKPIGRDESLFSGLQPVIAMQVMGFVAVGWVAFYIGSTIHLSTAQPPSYTLGQTLTFLALGWTAILHIFTVRSTRSMFTSRFSENPRLVVSAFAMVALFALLVLVPPLGQVFGLVPLSPWHWLIAIGLCLVPSVVAELNKAFRLALETRQYRNRLVHHTNHG